MKCWKCGADVAPGAAFCASCGARQEQDAPNSPVTPPPVGGDAGNGIVLTVFAAICMAVCGGLALRSLFAALGGFLHIGWAGVFSIILTARRAGSGHAGPDGDCLRADRL